MTLFSSHLPVLMPLHRVSLWHALALVLFVFGQKCSTVDTSDLEKLLGEAVSLALEHARLVVKDACFLMRVDERHFRKGLRAEENAHISLTRLVRLPFTFWLAFTPSLLYLVAKKHAADLANDFGIRKNPS